MGVVDRLVELRCDGVYVHLAAFLRCTVLLDDLCPEHTGGTEFGKLHEEVRRDAHVEFDAAVDGAGVEAGLCQQCHPLSAPSQSVAELLGDVGAGVVEHICVYGEAAEILDRLHGLVESQSGLFDIFREFKAMLEQALEGVEIDRTAEGVGGLLGDDLADEHLSHFHSVSGAASEVDLHLLQVEALQDLGESVGCQVAA